MTKDLVKEFYDRIAEDYDKEYETSMKLYNEITWSNIKRFLPKRKNAVVLDAGGGTGYWAIRLAKLGLRVVKTDITENMLRVDKEKTEKEGLQDRIETKIVDIRDMRCFPASHFDMALAEGDPVSYCLDAKKAIDELTRVTKANGQVIVSVDSKYPAISRLISERSFDKIAEFIGSGIVKGGTTGTLVGEFDFQAFTPEELKTLFEACGLKVVRIIGKPILIRLVPTEKRKEIYEKNFAELLELEERFCDTPSLVGIGGHLEIVGLKQE